MPSDKQPTIDLAPLAEFSLNLDQYTDLWAVDETRFAAILDHVSRLDLAAHVRSNLGYAATETQHRMQFNGGRSAIAVIDIRGVMTKRGSSLSDAGSTVKIRQSIRDLAKASHVDGIILRFDTPGGTIAGTADLAHEIRQAAKLKPVFGFVEDMCASAGYWAASQCAKLYANAPTAILGSIGTYTRLYDTSEAAGRRGIKVITIRAGQHKGIGQGEAISDEQVAALQGLVNNLQAEFTAQFAVGRNLSIAQAELLATGQAWTAREAESLGLIDGVKTFDETLSLIQSQVTSRKRGISMSTDTPNPVAATAADIRLACPDASDKFILGLVERGATAAQVTTAWTAELSGQLAKAKADAEAAEAKAEAAEKATAEAEANAKAKPAAGGVPPLGTGQAKGDSDSGGFSGDAVAEFSNQVRQGVKDGLDRPAAVKSVARANPELHQAYLLATNPAGLAGAINSRFQ